MDKKTEKCIDVLVSGGVGVMPTDTIYGIVGSAFSEPTVERIYQIKDRNPKKPLITLIAAINDLEDFGMEVGGKAKGVLERVWPGKVSVILSCEDERFQYLSRGTGTLSFRLPAEEEVRSILQKAGPLVAPSANPEGYPPAETVEQAKEYFGDLVDFYIDGGELVSPPSTLIQIEGSAVKVLRNGAVAFGD